MKNIVAKPLVKNKFWLLTRDGKKVGLLSKAEHNKYTLRDKLSITVVKSKKALVENYKIRFEKTKPININNDTINGFPINCKQAYNVMFDVKRKLPLFTKSKDSKCYYGAGYYNIKLNNTWETQLCPKFIMLERYPFNGPYLTEALAKANK